MAYITERIKENIWQNYVVAFQRSSRTDTNKCGNCKTLCDLSG